jgi:hypothetical protein
METHRIIEQTQRNLFGRRTVRRIEGEPTHEALRAWRDGGDIAAPSYAWLQAAVSDALDEIDRRTVA